VIHITEYVCWKHKGFDFFKFCEQQALAILRDYDSFLSPNSYERLQNLVVAARKHGLELLDE
jgi:hypothetical protein